MMSALLLITCSATKRIEPSQPLRAMDRYDGVFFRILRKWIRETGGSASLKIYILSAEFGLIEADRRIPYYDRKMTAARAIRLRPDTQRKLREVFSRRSYDSIFVNVGRTYSISLNGVKEIANGTWASGGIGQRAKALKAWLGSCQREGTE